MGTYFEAGIGKAVKGRELDMGRRAAVRACSQIKKFRPTLAKVFVSSELDIPEVIRGLGQVLDCPIIGTSTAGEIANGAVTGSVVVAVIASPHLKVRVGIGQKVSTDYGEAIRTALTQAQVLDYFSTGHPLHQTLYMSGSKNPGISPVLATIITPGATKNGVSLGHEIHTALRTASANRIPIFGGTSGDYFRFETNYQILNQTVTTDAFVLAFIETEILFGIGVAHGFSPTTKRALVTKASGHIVYELDGQPAAEVCARLLEIQPERLGNGAVWFSQFPFGGTDVYGNSLLCVPERILEDGSIQFGPMMSNNQVITLMRANRQEIVMAGLSAYEKALHQGGLRRPSFAFIYSCALRKRLMARDQAEEIALIRKKARIPVCGFYTFGEQGLTDDGLPIFANQSVASLVFSDELNPVTAFLRKGKRIYHEYVSRIDQQVLQMKVMSRANRIVQDAKEAGELLESLMTEISVLFTWASLAFYLPDREPHSYSLAVSTAHDLPERIADTEVSRAYVAIPLLSHGRRCGLFILKHKHPAAPDQENLMLAKTVGRLAARGLHRIDAERRLRIKLLQLELMSRFGRIVAAPADSGSQLIAIARAIRRVMKLSFVTLWVVDPNDNSLIREAAVSRSPQAADRVDMKHDETIAAWQVRNKQLLFSDEERSLPGSDSPRPPSLCHKFASAPVFYKGAVRAILNLYWNAEGGVHRADENYIYKDAELLESVSSQLGVIIENKHLEKYNTLSKEIHHRVKNNLQNIASILRLQITRLNSISPEQALADSVSRIISIAVVHDTLCHGEIGMVDISGLAERIIGLSVPAQTEIPFVLDVAGPLAPIPSKEATSLALVINELVQNAIKHGKQSKRFPKVSIVVGQDDHRMSVVIRNGGSLPHGFSGDCDGNLGLMIVRMLVKDELKGHFTLHAADGIVTSRIDFPL